jgi:soluble lytic murein transglycosylase
LVGLFLVDCAGSYLPPPRLPDALAPSSGIALDSSERASARALGRAARAIDAGDLVAGEWELTLARARNVLTEYQGFEGARLRAARGEYAAAAVEVAELRAASSDSPLAGALAELAGDCSAALGDEEAAREAWQVALAASTDPARRRVLGLALIASRQRSGELEEGLAPEDLLALVEASAEAEGPAKPGEARPENAVARADALLSRGRSAQAVAAYREALAEELDVEELRHTRFQLGVALFRLRKYGEALSVFGALDADPEARLWYARSLARSGRIDEAIGAFEELAPEAPTEIAIRARYLAATLLESEDESEQAMSHYAQIARDPDFPEQAQQALWRIGWSAWRAGEVRAARGHFEQMARREPDVLGALKPRYWAARAAEAMGRPRLGRSELGALARDWPLSYYGWRAQQRLGEDSVASRRSANPFVARPIAPLDEARLRRAALLLEAGYRASVQFELEPLLGRPCSAGDCVRLGSLLAGIGEYHQAQKLVVARYSVPLGQGLRPGYEALFWLAWPPAYAEFVRASAPESDRVDPALVWAIMREESGFRPRVMSSAGAMGLLQLMPETARRTAARVGADALEDSEMLFAPETNIALGSAYLDYLSERFPNQTSAVIASYNAGPNAVASWRKGANKFLEDDVWVEEIPYSQTRSYVRRVLRSLHAYGSFY